MVRHVPFNALPLRVRQRLVEVLHRRAQPSPIFEARSGGALGHFGRFSAMFLGAVSLFALTWTDFGSVSGELGVQPLGLTVGYAITLFILGWSVLATVRALGWRPKIPYPTGTYLFGPDLVDATGPVLKVLPLRLLEHLQPTHHYYNGGYTGTTIALRYQGGASYMFRVYGRELAERALANLRAAQDALQRAAHAGDMQALWQLDPLFECKADGTWDRFGAQPLDAPALAPGDEPATCAPAPPLLLRRAAVFSLVAAAALCLPVWIARNYLSDEARFDAIRSGRAPSWECSSYLRVGGAHIAEVRDRYLPEAALREAEAQHSVTALRGFLRVYPRSAAAARARALIHDHFARVQRSYAEQAATSDARMLPFMINLLQFMEAHDSPPVRVRFFPPSTAVLNRVDTFLQSEGMRTVGRPVAPIAGQFDQESSLPREQTITRSLQRAFQVVFPGDILRLEDGGRIEGGSADAQARVAPTFDVAYTVAPSGSFYTSDTRPRAFVGIIIAFQVSMHVPGGVEPYTFDVTVQPPQHFTVDYTRDREGAEPPDTLVYNVMAERAFDQLSDRFRGVFFRPGSPGYNGGSRPAEPDAADEPPPAPAAPPAGATEPPPRGRRHRRRE